MQHGAKPEDTETERQWLEQFDPRRRPPPQPMARGLKRFLRVTAVIGFSMVVMPLVVALVSIWSASSGVSEGLRGATHHPELRQKVGFAFSTTTLVAFCVPAGVLMGVASALALAGERKREADAARRTAQVDHLTDR